VNITENIGTHPQPIRYYLLLIGSTFRTMLSMGMLVAGTGLMGLAISVFLDGFGIVEIGLGLSIGEVLGAFIVIGVSAAFAFGVATEGRYGTAVLMSRYPSLEVVAGRVFGGVIVVLLLGWIAGQVESIVADQALPFRVGQEVIRATGSSGVLAVLIGVPGVWALRQGIRRAGFDATADVELPALYVLWAVFALIAFSMPAG
jgi:hypothetical protein